MTIQVRYLSESEIERDAELLLAEFEETTGAPIKLPTRSPISPPTTSRSGSGSPIYTKP
jgi:hypothetical protein